MCVPLPHEQDTNSADTAYEIVCLRILDFCNRITQASKRTRVAIHMHTWARAILMVSPRPFAVLLEQVWAVLGSKRNRRYMYIWLDLASGAARGLQPHRAVASAIADGYLAWGASRHEPQSDGVLPLSPALFLATIQGMYSLTAIGRPAASKTSMIEFSACV